ncbi:MAG: hypothetical protein LBV67_12585 [Streptococcaceae bacterium]|jgi:Tfp pilus assembly protein PilV|nr:hypothetical protein [Streptococcaceae bacterium]
MEKKKYRVILISSLLVLLVGVLCVFAYQEKVKPLKEAYRDSLISND